MTVLENFSESIYRFMKYINKCKWLLQIGKNMLQ